MMKNPEETLDDLPENVFIDTAMSAEIASYDKSTEKFTFAGAQTGKKIDQSELQHWWVELLPPRFRTLQRSRSRQCRDALEFVSGTNANGGAFWCPAKAGSKRCADRYLY